MALAALAGRARMRVGTRLIEGHKDPSQCSGITVDASGKIIEINLRGKNLTGKKSIFGHYAYQ
jgi:hypothetical protein